MFHTYRWGRALVRSSGICPEDERHPHVIKDFISLLQYNIRNKIANKWADIKNPPHTVQEAFDLAIKTETQIQVAECFKMELTSNFTLVDINKISGDETSSDKFELNAVSRGKKWNNNNYRKSGYNNNQNFSNKTRHNNKTQENMSGNKWECKERDAKITLLQESSHFVPTKCGESFFRQFDVAMQLRKEELKKPGKINTEVSEITKYDMISTFGVTKDHMLKVAEILGTEESTENLGKS